MKHIIKTIITNIQLHLLLRKLKTVNPKEQAPILKQILLLKLNKK